MGIIETIKMLTLEEGIEQGIEKGEERKSYGIVTKMLKSGKFTVSEISDFTDVPEDFIIRVQKEINSEAE
jgi:hypothetical protein